MNLLDFVRVMRKNCQRAISIQSFPALVLTYFVSFGKARKLKLIYPPDVSFKETSTQPATRVEGVEVSFAGACCTPRRQDGGHLGGALFSVGRAHSRECDSPVPLWCDLEL